MKHKGSYNVYVLHTLINMLRTLLNLDFLFFKLKKFTNYLLSVESFTFHFSISVDRSFDFVSQGRRSMVYAKHLHDIGDEFREKYLGSTDIKDKTVLLDDWTKMNVGFFCTYIKCY